MKIPSVRHRSMRWLSALTAVAVGLLLIGLADTISAQDKGSAKVDFPFVYGTQTLPAGTYDFEAHPMQGTVVLVPKDAKTTAVTMLVITRLGRHDNDPGTELVFDKVKDKLVLSEIWLANDDGYLVTNTPGYHKHRVLGGSHPQK